MEYGSGGALFVRDKKSPKAADYGGDITINGELLEYILKNAGRGEVKIEISGWKRMGRNNTTFISLKADTPYEVRKNAGNGYAQQQQNGYAQAASQNYAQRTPAPQQSERQSYSRPGTEGHRVFRRELDDEIPFGKPAEKDPFG